MYSDEVLDHFHNPRNVGEIEEPAVVAEASNPVCGDVMKLWILAREGRVSEATFKAAGMRPGGRLRLMAHRSHQRQARGRTRSDHRG